MRFSLCSLRRLHSACRKDGGNATASIPRTVGLKVRGACDNVWPVVPLREAQGQAHPEGRLNVFHADDSQWNQTHLDVSCIYHERGQLCGNSRRAIPVPMPSS